MQQVYPLLETAWFQPLKPSSENPVSKFAFDRNLCRYKTVSKSLDVALADAAQRAAHARSTAAALAPYQPVPPALSLRGTLGSSVSGSGILHDKGSSAVPHVQHGYLGWPGPPGVYGRH